MVTTCSPRPVRAVQRARLCAVRSGSGSLPGQTLGVVAVAVSRLAVGPPIIPTFRSLASIQHVGAGDDPGAAGAPFAPVDAEAWREYAADLQRDGLPLYEALRVAAIICH